MIKLYIFFFYQTALYAFFNKNLTVPVGSAISSSDTNYIRLLDRAFIILMFIKVCTYIKYD